LDSKTVIGLTGNIGTGKSVVRRMLEHLGAYGIDADALSHRALSKGAPGYQKTRDVFGQFILGEDGEIDRAKLGKLVFADPEALANLEAIVHPLVRQALAHLMKKAEQDVIVIEAIKLLESPLKERCDVIWVVTAPEEVQTQRLISKRGMNAADVNARLANQSPQHEKTSQADVVIANNRTVEDTWDQVSRAWRDMFGDQQDSGPIQIVSEAPAKGETFSGPLDVRRAKPGHAEEIASLITRLSSGQQAMTRMDVMEAFGEKAFLLLLSGEQMVGVMGWQVENLVARAFDLWLEPALNLKHAVDALIPAIEEASNQLQAEAVLCFVSPQIARDVEVWTSLGYEHRTPESLSVTAWQEAAHESKSRDTEMFFKQLRADRILRPM
jgi:dephospho-CoA kinase